MSDSAGCEYHHLAAEGGWASDRLAMNGVLPQSLSGGSVEGDDITDTIGAITCEPLISMGGVKI